MRRLLDHPRLLVALLALLELLGCVGDLLLGPYGRVHWEERFNARAGVQIACGHLDRAFQLQYVPFCGGCTGEALLSAPLYRLLGPTVLVWKLVPIGFHALVLSFGAVLANRAAGWRAALLWVLLLMGAPGYYRELVLTGWGNHVESAAFPLGAALILLAAAGLRRALWRPPLLALAGLVTGLGLWFCHTSAWAVPALLLGAALVSRWSWPLFVAMVPVGFLPWRLYFEERAEQAERTVDWAVNIVPAPPAALVDWLWGPYLRWGLWDPTDHGEGSWVHSAWWFLFWGVGLAGLLTLLRLARRTPADDRGALLARLFAPVSIAALIVAYALRYDLWKHLPEVPAQPTLGLRYRAPLVPILSLGVAAAVARAWASPRWRWPALAAGLSLSGFGVGRRVALWQELRTAVPGLHVYAHEGWWDRSVPPGEPPQRNARQQGRPQDVQAALDFLEQHDDTWPECHLDHLFEAGRRLGIAGRLRGPAGIAPFVARAETDTAADEAALWFLASGMAKGLVGKDGTGLDRAEELRAGLADSALSTALGLAAGRRLAEDLRPGDEGPLHLSAAAFDGLCEERGATRAVVRSRLGSHRPGPDIDPAVDEAAGSCLDSSRYWWGVGRVWARQVGCRSADQALLARESGAFASSAAQGLAFGCRVERAVELVLPPPPGGPG